MINLDNVVQRLLKIKGLSQGKEAANILGISPADFSNRKKRGSLLPLLVEWAEREGINLQWFITGDEPNLAETEKRRKFQIFNEAEEWLNEEVNKNPKREIWFEVEFERAFEEFKKWKEEKEESAGYTDSSSTRKVA
ncbi:helix-turn-helix domain-containing protein [Desulfobulbus rhabdoformis]|uniref:helix-turn-helix domain-containing protein n=1 Tax=Desulfobulbus rhabdoformis TaxID=34032 RepID=UPI0019634744|nr:helix-turn-helix domain-containing protein [Desulfobulbus rhabdoformis]MBM9615269.1 helix-turn-helix domain-containing protein [Desulfobulbus rhabdoformis]